MWKKNKKKIKLKEYFVLLLLLFSVVVTVIPSLVSADDPTIDPYVAPGAPEEISMDQLLKIGILDDTNHITGEHAWDGAMLAAREINEAGGLFINSTHYYIGLVAENTFEAEFELDIDKGIDAANTMIMDYDPHVIVGGFMNDAVIHYLEPIMDAKIPFICTGANSDIFSQNVLDNYPRYKYFFRTNLNGSEIGREIITYIPYLANTLAEILNKDVTKVAILREDLEWTLGLANAMKLHLPSFGLEVVEDIAFSYDSSEQDLINYWYQIEASGAQIVVPITNIDRGVLIGRTYGEVRPNCIVCGVNIEAQLGNYWDDTYGGAQYEITVQGTYRTKKTPKTIPFWDNFANNYSQEPYYTAVSSYDAIYLLSNATLSTQSFNADQIVLGLEQITSTNIFTGVGGNIAFTSSHDLRGGPDYVSMLFCQWQEGGTKVVLPSGNILYPDSFATGSLVIPEWARAYPILIYGTGYGPTDLDPHYAWDSASIDVIDQVVESLFAYNLSDPSLKSIPRLASAMGMWSDDNLNYTVELRNDVIFHDGTSFNATGVKWNFDRLAHFLNITGTLPEEVGITQLEELFRWPDGTPIINRTEIIHTYKIKFVLNRPYAPLVALLSFYGTRILSPTSTPADDYINTYEGDLVGTGPFVYDYYDDNFEVRFHAFEDYWAGAAEIKGLIFSVIPDPDERNQALLLNNIDFLDSPLTSMLDDFESDPEITLVDVGQSTTISYLGMNNKQINKTMRHAISYAINYSYIINEITGNHTVRMKSPVPEGILYANWSFNVATMNITHARKILVDNGVCNFDIYNDDEWLDAAVNNPIANYTYRMSYSYSWLIEPLGHLLADNLEKIGIKIVFELLEWEEFLDRMVNNPDTIDLFYIGWVPDFNDPSNFINPLLSNVSSSNFAQVNDPDLEDLMEQGLAETNPSAREAIYDKIQKYIVEDLMPWAFGYVPRNYDAYRSDLIGYQSNPMDKLWFYSVSGVSRQDESPPFTTFSLSGIEGFEGSYITDVIVNLLATDELSGVAITEYSFDNVNWITYEGPITITDEGITTLYYRSTDHAGNVEYSKGVMIRIQSRHYNNRFLIYGTNAGPVYLDPHYAWDRASIDVIDQVVESLFAYNLSDPSLISIPRLASAMGTWSDDNLNYTVTLRSGVTFHDGTPFDAAAVQWNFDRLAHFLNITGTLPEEVGKTQLEELFRWPDGTPIINRTEIRDTYIIRFVLNKPFAALEALLSSWATGILSPTSTPADDYINTYEGDLVGTGPFVYDYYADNLEVRFHAFEDYWAGEAKIKNLIFSVIPDPDERNQALLLNNIDFLDSPLTSMLDDFESDPEITLVDVGQSTTISYLGMNNKQINNTMRKAISYAINYSYIIDEIKEGQAVRMKSPVPEGILYANWSFNVATYNLTKAREYMVNMGYGNLSWTDGQWQAANFLTFNYTYNVGNTVREAIFTLLQNNLMQIGIQVTDAGMSWEEFINRLYEIDGLHRDMLQLFYIGWGPDYNDPSNFLNALFSNASSSNGAQVNDPRLEDLMAQGMAETNPIIRKGIYDEIQQYIVEELMPWAFGYVPRNYDAYRSDLIGYQSNPMDKVWFYSVSRVPYWICNETAEWGVEAGDKLAWEVSGYWLEMVYGMLFQEVPVQWMMDIDAINLTYWEDLPSKNVPCDFYSTIWATMYNRSMTEGAPWEEWMPLFPLTFYNACEQLIYNQFFGFGQNWPHLVIPVPVNLEILNNSLYEFLFYAIPIENISSSIKDNSLQYVLLNPGPGMDTLTINYTYNNQGILTHLFLLNSTEDIWLDMKLIDTTPPEWIEIPTDQEVELGSRFSYNVSAYDEFGIDHYWISDTENFEINSSGWIGDKDFLELGVYEFEVRAYDPHDNYCTATITITVVDSTSPFGIGSIYDTIPNITLPEFLTYTRTPQIIGSVKVFDHSPIANVELWCIDPLNNEYIAEGFVLDTIHHPQSPFGVYDYRYTSDIIIQTTSLLKEGVHTLNLRVYDAQGNVANKYFNITVFRLLNLKLSGEFDYLIREDVKISIVANLLDAETNMQVDPSWISDMGVVMHIIIWDPQGNNLSLGTTEMTYISGGEFKWQSDDTIKKLFKLFDKGVYRVSAYIEFNGSYDPSLWYYRVNQDVIQFHIDPPAAQEPDLWITFAFVGYGGLIILNLVLLFFYRKKYRRR